MCINSLNRSAGFQTCRIADFQIGRPFERVSSLSNNSMVVLVQFRNPQSAIRTKRLAV
jgi:hypothetical protein